MKLDRNAYIDQTLPGGFHLRRFVGQGAFAWVYEAATPSGDAVAVKIQHNLSDDSYKRFIREIKVLRELPGNEHCVRYVGDGETSDGLPFLAMEFVDGKNLKQILKKRPLWPEREACEIMVQLCEAFAGIHQLGLVHRDVKPENIMLSRSMEVKLMDFGLIKDAQGLLKLFEDEDILEGRDFAENIDRGVLAGTPEYMAPEQFSDPSLEDSSKEQTDTWTDVYSLGLIFYELLSGKKLFPFRIRVKTRSEHAKALIEYLHERTNFDETLIQRPELASYELWTILELSLRQGPKQRQRNATEFGKQIRHYLETGEGIIVEDDDKTSAIKIDSFLARYGQEILKRQMAADEAADAAADSYAFAEDEHTVPINREQLKAITDGIEQAKGDGVVEDEARTTRWSREETAALLDGTDQELRSLLTQEPSKQSRSATTKISAAPRPHNNAMPLWKAIVIGTAIGVVLLMVFFALV